MVDLTAFLAARLDEDEAAARLAAREGGTWVQEPDFSGSITSLGGQVVYDEGCPDEYQAAHIARHDPARVLREVQAKRAILDLHRPEPMRHIEADRCPRCSLPWPCAHVRALAAVYSDHLDYRDKWKPVTAPAGTT